MIEPETPVERERHPTLPLAHYAAEEQSPPPAQPAPPADPPSAMLGRYEIKGSLGAGGMADVLLVRDARLGRELAAKILRQGLEADPGWMDKFLLEAQICGQLQHPNIVPVHDLDLTADGRLYFTMKRIEGTDLDRLLRKEAAGPEVPPDGWTLSRLLEVFVKVCDAVDFAHSRGVVHRDLKPANIMVGRFGEVQVMDWGLATMRNAEGGMRNRDPAAGVVGETWHQVVMGTPAYMPPEQAAGEPTDERADIYALGAMLYEILTLQPPYDGGDPYHLIEQLQAGPPLPPGARAPERAIPWELEAVVARAMARRPEERYGRVAEILADIQAYLEGRTLQAAEYAVWQRLLKWAGRHRAAVAAVLSVLLISLGLYGGIRRQARLQQERAAARAEQLFDGELRRLQRQAQESLAEVERLAGPGARRLVEPNGELAREAVAHWYRLHAEALDTLQQIARLAPRAPTPAARARIELDQVERKSQRLALSAAHRAAELGDDTLALLWVRRAVAAGLQADGEREARARIEQARKLRISGLRYSARAVLLQARKLRRTPGDWYEWAMADLLRKRGPHLVRLLLDPEHLDSRHEWERRLAIEALGRLGDTRTIGPEGQDPVEALGKRLGGASLQWELELAVLLAQALGFLEDSRAHRVLAQQRALAGPNSPFWQRTAAAFARIPRPDDLFGQNK